MSARRDKDVASLMARAPAKKAGEIEAFQPAASSEASLKNCQLIHPNGYKERHLVIIFVEQ